MVVKRSGVVESISVLGSFNFLFQLGTWFPAQACLKNPVHTPLDRHTPSSGQTDTPLDRHKHSWTDRHTTPGQTPTRTDTLLYADPPWADTPWAKTPPGETHPWTDTPGQTPPPPRQPLQQMVCILLECILVSYYFSCRSPMHRVYNLIIN